MESKEAWAKGLRVLYASTLRPIADIFDFTFFRRHNITNFEWEHLPEYPHGCVWLPARLSDEDEAHFDLKRLIPRPREGAPIGAPYHDDD